MGVSISMRLKQNAIEENLKSAITRVDTMQAYLDRVVYRQYQKAQAKRWMTENTSEGPKWDPLNPKYAESKLRRFASFPGGGKVLLVATSRLADAATGINTAGIMKVASNRGIQVNINLGYVPYAAYVAAKRSFMTFGTETLRQMHSGILRYIMRGDASWADTG